MLVTLRNDFHNTEVRLRAKVRFMFLGGAQFVELSKPQTLRARRKLCPVKGCQCVQGPAGHRGLQSHNGKPLAIATPNLDS